MDENDWDELEAQVDTHGIKKLEFYLSDADENGRNLLLSVTNIKFEDDEIKVILE